MEVDMGTTILAWLIAILGLLMIAGGTWDVADLWNQRRRTLVPLREWGIAIGLICGGFGMFGIAQGLTPIARSGHCGRWGTVAIRNGLRMMRKTHEKQN